MTTDCAAVTVTISRAAFHVAGWDDPCLISDMARTVTPRGVVLTADRATLRYAADVMSDYADVEQCGDGFTPGQRRAARAAEARIRAALAAPAAPDAGIVAANRAFARSRRVED